MRFSHPTTPITPTPPLLPFAISPDCSQPCVNALERAHKNAHTVKSNRYLMGLLAGVAFFYLFGHALGLGRR